MKDIRFKEYGVLVYRIVIVYIFYFIARVLFYVFNHNLIEVDSVTDFLRIAYHGLRFDSVAIMYANMLFIFLSVIPTFVSTSKPYQKMLFYVYFITNAIGYSLNFVDMVYYPFSKGRLTIGVRHLIENEQNKFLLFLEFAKDYWYIPLIFAVLMWLWIKLYRLVRISHFSRVQNRWRYVLGSIVGLLFSVAISVFLIRGGSFHRDLRPITIVDAMIEGHSAQQADLILNSTFSFFRTIGEDSFKLKNWLSSEEVQKRLNTQKQYHRKVDKQPNIVVFILESFAKEYIGCVNQNTKIKDFQSYTPFLDSLSQYGFVFDNAYANGYKSIHGMPSVLAGIPSFKDAFSTSPYVKQEITSAVSIANELGYDTSFFHGATNGSMGFLGFSNILGFKHYFGRTEYNDESGYIGVWGIPDEPFLQYMEKQLSQRPTPFFATVFTLSSHHPFKVPPAHQNRFNTGKIPMHNVIMYSDFALKRFFEEAKKEPWFNNTIFVFTADHTSEKYYPEYRKISAYDDVPIIFYSPNPELISPGRSHQLAQQIDIYPTLVDLMGYNKPFRSWGRSLLSGKDEKNIIIHYASAGVFVVNTDKYTYLFDGEKVTEIYAASDREMKHNLKGEVYNTEEVQNDIADIKAFIQDYMDRIIHHKLK